MSKESFTLVRLTEELLPKVHTLFAEARNLYFPKGYFLRKYGINTPELRFVGFLALDNNQNPAGLVAMVPRQLQRGGNFFIGGELVDAVTHPRHRGKGLFVQLSKQVMVLAQTLGLELIFAPLNHLSAPILVNKLGWQLYDQLPSFDYKCRGVDWYRYATRFSPTRKLYFQIVKRKMGHLLMTQTFPKPNRTNVGTVVWDSLFFESKRKGRNLFLNFEGFLWWFRFDGGLFVAALEPAGDKVRAETFKEALPKLLNYLGVRRVFGSFPKESFAAQCFGSLGSPSANINMYIYPLTDLARESRWEFSLADCDSF